jgi:hypothetical protein
MASRTILDAALSILADGKPRTTGEILAEAHRRGLLGRDELPRVIGDALQRYIQRQVFHGRKSDIIEDPGHRFRLNRPIDDWPAIDNTGLPPLTIGSVAPVHAAAIATLHKTASGSDPAAFESAVCAMLQVFGFASTHLGGVGAPDGYVDALLGELRYRVMIECKLSRDKNISKQSAVAEAAKYRDAYRADYCVLVAPSFDDEVTFVSELHTHGVAAWAEDDFVRAAILRLDCSQMRELFAPGFAADVLADLAWAQVHGLAKRLRVVASLLVESGLSQQRLVQTLGDNVSTPRLTADVALSLLDDRLTAAGSTLGVTPEEIDAAFTWLTSP